jgi:hypothetical protein
VFAPFRSGVEVALSNKSLRPWAGLLLIFAAARAPAGDLTKVWEMRLSELKGSKITDAAAHIFSVSFSPDGHHLATVVRGRQRGMEILAVVDIDSPREGFQMTEYEGPVGVDEFGPSISWSSAGEALAAPEVFQDFRQPGCVLEHTIRAVYYDADRVVDLQPGFPTSDLLSFDGHCNAVGSWKIEGQWQLFDGSVERHLVTLANALPKAAQIIVVDPDRRMIVNRWPLEQPSGGGGLFADNGKAVCGLDGTGKQGVAHCWDLDSGRELGRTSSGNPHIPMATALRARRVILSHYGWRIDFEAWETEVGDLHRRVVWDFGTGKEIASWKPRYQDDVSRPARKEPYRFAISPDGRMVAEGGSGLLTLYRIGP